METLPLVVSVNVGPARPTEHSDVGFTGIDKRPASGPVQVTVPGRGGSGLAGDVLCDTRFHGGVTQAVYAFAREDLDEWASTLGRVLDNGVFGENLTTSGLDVTGAIVGERWRIGSALLEVTAPRIPCRTFAGWLGEQGWIKTFTKRAAPGAYLRVVEQGQVRAGDSVTVLDQPSHGVSVGESFRALTTARDLLPRLLMVESLADTARKRLGGESESE
ncbi:MOSC domain containing protein [Catenulispora acidiphila DSM 44928]|uniref:MOSC domain containing protein n=1 Tax=Catenulispora acidiphila (strain DSM 44928 / JCM 14897 / NBRC 102108 / NRRL B-24433 / ID139908) TaxID=479433 RepID=C7QBU1_CATAD|nr:MOSC domain-containing protein [Catenulispora acidiphila]ACU72560.1 MOSC domain containing protein [Catenulispora acidiphila DSM 44928]